MMVVANRSLFNKSFDFLVSAGHFLATLAFNQEIKTSLTWTRFAIVIEILTLRDYLATGHIQNTLKEIF
jgi:hypothetical protein